MQRHFFPHIKKPVTAWTDMTRTQLSIGPRANEKKNHHQDLKEERGKRQRIVKIKRGESFQTFVLTFGIINQTSKHLQSLEIYQKKREDFSGLKKFMIN